MTLASSDPIGTDTLHLDRTRHYIAVRLLPFLFVLYIVNYVDRTNLAYAALGMTRDLGFGDRVIGLGAGIFFVSYVALQIPGALLVERWSARQMISASMIAWGSLTALTALVRTPGQLYLARFVLGAAEAGFFPGVIVYLSHWFISGDRAKATSNFMAAIPLSAVLGSPLAGWILGHAWLGLAGWRWLFVVEGLPAILLGAVAFFFLTDWPREAGWLGSEQRQWIEEQLQRDDVDLPQAMPVWQAVKSNNVLLMALVTFLNYFLAYCFIFWFPTLLKRQSGFSDVRVGLLGAVPYVAAVIAMQVNGWHSDRYRERRWHAAVPVLAAAGALLILLAQVRSMPLFLALFTLVGIALAYLPVFWAIPTETLGHSAAAPAVGMINAVGSIAGFAGPYAFGYLYNRTGSFSVGLSLMIATGLVGGLLTLRIPDVRLTPIQSR